MRLIYRFLMAALIVGTASSAQIAAADSGTNWLVNPSFEGLYSKQCCQNTTQFQVNTPIDQVQVAYGWTAWWVEPDSSHPNHCDNCNPYSRPQYNSSTIAHSGVNSQYYYTTYAIHEAGLYQRVTGLQPGQRVQFGAYMYAYSNQDNPFALRVGIDPTGGTNPFSANVVWGPSYSALNSWLLFTAETTAQSSTVTVFTYSRPNWPYQTQAVYVDDASLVVSGAGPSGPNGAPFVLSQNGNGQVLVAPNNPVAPVSGVTVNPSSYTVQPGDSLIKIGRKFGVTAAAIKAANNLKTDTIQIGQVLIIPKP
jgi:LysM repeat protein